MKMNIYFLKKLASTIIKKQQQGKIYNYIFQQQTIPSQASKQTNSLLLLIRARKRNETRIVRFIEQQEQQQK